MADLDAIRAKIRLLTLVGTADLSDAELLTLVNEGLYQVSTKFDWPFLQATTTITTADGTSAYAIPADHVRTFQISDTTRRRRLIRTSLDEVLQRYGDDFPEASNATHWYLWDDEYNLVPTPNAAATGRYKVYYQKSATALASGTDTPEWADQFHDVLAFYGEMRVWERENDPGQSQLAQARFQQSLDAMARFYLNLAADAPIVIGGGHDGVASRHSNTPWIDDGLS